MKGWIFDAYPSKDKMIVWIKQENGQAVRLAGSWTHSIYVAVEDKAEYRTLLESPNCRQYIKSHKLVQRRERLTDTEKSWVLKLDLTESSKAVKLAREIEALGRFGKYRLYNVDLQPAQAYFYEHDLFPLAFCDVKSGQKLEWTLLDDVWSYDYALPELRTMYLEVRLRKEGKLPKHTDKLAAVKVKAGEDREYGITGESEAEILSNLQNEVTSLDPDFILTYQGDAITFPYLIYRASENEIQLSFGRERAVLVKPSKEGTSFFSYGRIHFKPSAIKLQGRVHLDTRNSFAMDASGFQGLYEITRICRMPLHTSSRASIGRCLSSLQFYYATKQGILIPWKPVIAEHFKSYRELLVADRGGFILEPRPGVYERVAEFDFASLYPSIMSQKNVSAETVKCPCCPDSKNRVPELGYNICEKRRGIVPQALEIVLKKRARYKLLKKDAPNGKLRETYDSRQTALKWINVTSFGYLGFNNAKFGRIDAHIAVCAFDRQIFLQAMKIAERRGFRVLHGIVDSIWVQKHNATADDYLALKDEIEQETGFSIAFEGVYKWIAFLQSKENDMLPVANRYFGAFEDGTLKVRGIEARRHDTPALFSKCQNEALAIMARGDSIAQVRALMPEVQQCFEKYAAVLRAGKVALEDLLFTKQLSKDSAKYLVRNTIETYAISQLSQEGKSMKAGQVLRYLITDYKRRKTVPVELLDERTMFDSIRYVDLLANACESITSPFEQRITRYPSN